MSERHAMDKCGFCGHPDYNLTRNKKFAELIVQETTALLQQEWYDLNSAHKVEDESPRDVGLRVGRKGEIISLIAKIKKHFGIK